MTAGGVVEVKIKPCPSGDIGQPGGRFLALGIADTELDCLPGYGWFYPGPALVILAGLEIFNDLFQSVGAGAKLCGPEETEGRIAGWIFPARALATEWLGGFAARTHPWGERFFIFKTMVDQHVQVGGPGPDKGDVPGCLEIATGFPGGLAEGIGPEIRPGSLGDPFQRHAGPDCRGTGLEREVVRPGFFQLVDRLSALVIEDLGGIDRGKVGDIGLSGKGGDAEPEEVVYPLAGGIVAAMPDRHGALVVLVDAVELSLGIGIVVAEPVDGVVVNQHVDFRLVHGDDRHDVVVDQETGGRIVQIDAVDIKQPAVIGHALVVGDLGAFPVRHPGPEAVGVAGQERGILEEVMDDLAVNRVDAEHPVAGTLHRVVGKELFLARQLESNGAAFFRQVVKVIVDDPVSPAPDHQHASAPGIGQFAIADLVALAVPFRAFLIKQRQSLEPAVGRRLARKHVSALPFDILNGDEFLAAQVDHRLAGAGFDLEPGRIGSAGGAIKELFGFGFIDPLVVRIQQCPGA